MELRLLGPLEVIGDDGRVVDVPGAKLSGLLVLLALHVGDVVSTTRIIEDLWGEREIRDPVNAAQVLVSKLRRVLRPGLDPADREVIATAPVGYSLTLAPDLIDVVRFEDLAREGRERLGDGDAPTAAMLLREALELWRGAALADFVDADFTLGARVHLEELRVGTVEQRVEADLALGRHDELVAELERLVVEAPLRERLREQLMLSLYRSGRQADALRAYEMARETFVDQLGIEPGPELRRLESAILDQDPTLDFLGPARQAARTGYLPTPVSGFVGRVDELVQLENAMGAGRLVTLVGPGGVGKTRLAIETARRVRATSPDGCWFVDLAPLTEGQQVAAAVARTLGLDESDRLVEYLVPRRAVIVLDNCEHLVDAVAELVARLLREAPELRVLATSREGMGLTGERRWPVPPMSPEDASKLFLDRASEAGYSADSVEARLVEEVCVRLDGLPLALELAAARTRTLSLADIAVRIEDRFRLLAGGDRTAEPRQRTMRGMVEWSYDLLFSDEQRVFRRLSVFAGGFGLDAAERVVAGDDVAAHDVLDLIDHLVDKSLVNVTRHDGATRFELLQTLADYGGLKLADAHEELATRARHLEWIVDLAGIAAPELRGADQRHGVAVIATERANIRTAVHWALEQGRDSDAVTIGAALGYGWYMTGAVDEGRDLLQAALAAKCAVPRAETAIAHTWCAWLLQFGAGASTDVVQHAERAVELARGTSSQVFTVAAVVASLVRGFRGLTDDAVALVAEASALLDEEPDAWSQAWVDWARSGLALKGGDAEAAATMLRSSVSGFESVGDACGVAIVSIRLSDLAEVRGDYAEAIESATSAYESIVGFGAQTFNASTLATRLGNLAALEDRFDDAARWHDIGLERARHGSYSGAVAEALSGAGHAAYRQGRLDEAEAKHREACASYEASGSVEGVAASLASLGFIAIARGDHDAAVDLHRRSLREASRGGDRRATALAVEGLAEARLVAGDPREAGRLLGVAEEVRRTGGALAPSLQPGSAAHTAKEVLALLGSAEFDVVRALGAEQVDATISTLLSDVGVGA